jgi:hypothetical protein
MSSSVGASRMENMIRCGGTYAHDTSRRIDAIRTSAWKCVWGGEGLVGREVCVWVRVCVCVGGCHNTTMPLLRYSSFHCSSSLTFAVPPPRRLAPTILRLENSSTSELLRCQVLPLSGPPAAAPRGCLWVVRYYLSSLTIFFSMSG